MCALICTLAPDATNIRGGFAHVCNKCLYSGLPSFTPFHSTPVW